MNDHPPVHAPFQNTIGSLLSVVWRLTDRSLRLRVFASILLTVAMVSLNSTSPLIYKDLVNWFAVAGARSSLEFPLQLIIDYLVLVAIGRICAELRWAIYGVFEQGVQHRLSLLLFDHVHSLSFRYHLERKTGGLQQVIFNGLLGFRLIVFNFVVVILPLVLNIILVGTVLTIFYPVGFVSIMLLICTLYILSLFLGVERQRTLQRSGNNAYQDAHARTMDSFLNFETIKLFGGEQLIRNGLDEALSRGQRSFVRSYLLRTLTGLTQSGWLILWRTGTIALAAAYVMHGIMTVGDFVLVNAYILQLWMPLDSLGMAYREIKMGQTNVERMLSLLNQRADVVDSSDATEIPAEHGELRFDDVEFSYDSRRPVLKGVSFRVAAGHTVAIVGPSGSGKSTIARLAFRFYDVSAGRITMSGVPIEAFTLKSLRSTMAAVPQDTVLFNDTIGYNIGIARDGCSLSEIKDAARVAEIHDFIHSLPEAYQTTVGERGLKLSGGQRQRIAIARAVLKRANLLIFDEATSALDSATEDAIQRNVRNAFGGISMLIITHRLSAIVNAEEVVVLNQGCVAERGSHNQLLRMNGLYAEMWRRQQEEKYPVL